jgi:ABC-2 type transport system ATP-binding protein
VRQCIGYLPESPYFYDYLTAEELLMYFASLFGFSAADSRMRAGRLLDELGIGSERRWPLRKFSKGMLQRVGLAQALINDPELVILDEPMSGLDPIGRRDVRALILRLRDEGRTVFFSSHVLSDAEALCSRVVILAHGRMVASGTVSDLVAFQRRGWELIAGSLAAPLLERIKGRVGPIVQVGPARYSIELPADPPPHLLVSELAAAGAEIVSLNPIRDTLESVFIDRVASKV